MGAYEDIFGDDEGKPKGSTYDQLFAEPAEPATLNDAGRQQQLEQTGDWYTQHYGTPGAAASTLGGGALEYLSTILGAAPTTGAAKTLGVGMASGAMGGAGGAIREGAGGAETAESTLLGTILGMIPAGLGKVTEKAGDAFSYLGRKADNTKAGSTSKIRDDLIERYGIEDGPDKLGELVRKYSPSSLFSPKTSAGHLKAIEGQLTDEGFNRAAMVRQAGAEGADAAAPAAYAGAQNEMLNTAAGLDDEAIAAGKASEVQMLEQILNRTAAKPVPQSLEGIISKKSQLGDEAFRPVTGVTDEDARSQAAKHAWIAMRGAEDQALSAATPDTVSRVKDSEKTFSELMSLNESLRPRAAADDAVGNVGTAAVGAVAGAMMPGGQGIMGALTSGTNNAVRQMTGGVAHDMFANVMHPAAAGMRGLSDGAMSSNLGAAVGSQAMGRSMQGQTRGHELPSVVRNALQNNPELLAPFAQQLADADMRGDLREELLRLGDNPEWRSLSVKLTGSR